MTKRRAVEGTGGAFMVTRGKPRYQYMQGRHYVVGRGEATECATVAAAYALRDERLQAEDAKRAAKKDAAAPSPGAPPVADGAQGKRCRIDKGEGVVLEVGARSLLVKTEDGNMWRRAPTDVEVLA